MELTQQANRTSSTSGRAKACRFCDSTDTSPENWPQRDGRPLGLQCTPCLRVYHNTYRALSSPYRRKVRDARLAKRERLYNVSYDDQWRLQMGCCAVCEQPSEELLVFDHNHRTGLFRGLLCPSCNAAAGMLGDDVDRIRALADYIEHGGCEQIASLS